MVTDDQVLVEDDIYILDRIKDFLQHPEVSAAPAAKTLLNIIERKVSIRVPQLRTWIYMATLETRQSQISHAYAADILPSSADHPEGHE